MLHILTLTWNGCERLTKLKNSLLPALDNIDYTWHIKDNGSTDDTAKEARTWGDKINLIQYKDNLQSFSQGTNYTFNAAKPNDNDLVLLLNNDIVFKDKTSLSKMIAMLKNDVGIVGAKLTYTGTSKLQHAGVVFTEPYKLPINYRAGQNNDDTSSKRRYFQSVTGAVLLMKSEIIKSMIDLNGKGLDENYIWCFEDVDLCLHAVYNLKKKIAYCGDVKIEHEESATLKKNNVNKLFFKKNAQYFLDKWKNIYHVDKPLYDNDSKYNVIK